MTRSKENTRSLRRRIFKRDLVARSRGYLRKQKGLYEICRRLVLMSFCCGPIQIKFRHIYQGSVTGNGGILRLPQCPNNLSPTSIKNQNKAQHNQQLDWISCPCRNSVRWESRANDKPIGDAADMDNHLVYKITGFSWCDIMQVNFTLKVIHYHWSFKQSPFKNPWRNITLIIFIVSTPELSG